MRLPSDTFTGFGVRSQRPGRALALVAIILLSATSGVTQAQDGEKLPPGERVLDNYVEVTGGKSAYQKLKNRKITATMSVPAQGLTMQLVSYSAPPNLAYTEFSSEQFGQIKDGCDGETTWQIHPMMGGPRVKEGAEHASALREATFNSELIWRSVYAKAECVGMEEIDGKPAYKIELTPKGDDPTTETAYYAKDSGLLLKREQTQETPMGAIPVVLLYDGYKKVDGILVPHSLTFMQMGMEMKMDLDAIESNVEIPKDRFQLPDEVKQVLAGDDDDEPHDHDHGDHDHDHDHEHP